MDGHQRVRGLPNVFAVGDVSINPDVALPQLAQPAIQGGQHVAAVISEGRLWPASPQAVLLYGEHDGHDRPRRRDRRD